ncbi:MAG: hypothetical protein LBU65_16455 [Planctomycetaceae bacterium]|jgi:type II secretory pathway pseudopilin PulG|nr:hypothetical protein [Planctomycetaceae bacterium]
MRCAFSLFELLVVLGLLVLIAGLGYPSMRRTVARGRLDSAIQELQAELGRTRLTAMKDGLPYVVRYQHGTNVYEIMPKEIFDNQPKEVGATALGTDSLLELPTEIPTVEPATSPPTTDAQTVTQAPIAGGTFYRKMLPNTVIFPSLPPAANPNIGDAIALGTEQTNIPTNVWSELILFYPNGRITETTVTLQTNDSYRYTSTIKIRGLTGTITITK